MRHFGPSLMPLEAADTDGFACLLSLTRGGDAPHSKADISKITNRLGYRPCIRFYEGLEEVYYWYDQQMKANG